MSKLGFKIFLIILFMSIGGLLITVFSINYGIGFYFSQYVEEEMDKQIFQLSERLEENIRDGRLDLIPVLLDNFTRDQHTLIYLEKIDGEVLYSNIDQRGLGRRQPTMMPEETDRFIIKNQDGKDYAYLYWQIPGQHRHATEDSSRFIYNVNRTVFQVAALMIILTGIIGFFLSRYLTLPLIKMNNLATKVAEGDYQQRVDIRKGDELYELGESLNQMSSRLNYLEKIREESVGDLAHELRTPLAIVSNYLMAIRDGVLENNEATFAEIEEELARLQKLVNRLEDLAEIETKILNLEKKEIDLKLVLEKITRFYLQEAELKKIEFKTIFTEKRAFIEGDYDGLKTIFINLLSNAFKYTPSGAKVILELTTHNKNIIVKIIDTGIGISEDELPYIFSRFYRTDKSRSSKTGGAGLGLTIVKKLIKAHGAEIKVESNEKGTTFTVIFQARLI